MKERGGKKEKIKVSQHDERGAMQFQAQAGAQGKKTSGAPNWRRKEIKTMNNLFNFWYLNKKCRVPLFHNYDFFHISPVIHHTSAVPSCRKKLVISSWQMEKEVNLAPLSPLLVSVGVEHMWQIKFEWRNV